MNIDELIHGKNWGQCQVSEIPFGGCCPDFPQGHLKGAHSPWSSLWGQGPVLWTSVQNLQDQSEHLKLKFFFLTFALKTSVSFPDVEGLT